MVTRDEILEIAKTLISGDRQEDYGDAGDSFKSIARLWAAYLDVAVVRASPAQASTLR